MRSAPVASAKLIGLSLAVCLGGGVGFAQAPQATSTRIVAFSDDAAPEEAKAPEAAPPAVEAPTSKPAPPSPPRVVNVARVIPPAPKVLVYSSRKAIALGRQAAREFAARPASSTSLALNSSYGVRYDPFTGAARMHTGIDLAATYGQTVGASMSGAVAFAGVRGGYGNIVIVDHGGGISTYYAHLSAIAVVVGQEVGPGEIVGYVGSTGRSTGPHLHYEVRANGHPLNPFSTIALENEQLYVEGRLLKGAADPFGADALPVAPGGTQIGVVWDTAAETAAATKDQAGKSLLVVDTE